jgi:hypothetical protein
VIQSLGPRNKLPVMRSLLATAVSAALGLGALTAGCTGDIGEPETQDTGSSGNPPGIISQDGFKPAAGGMRRLLAHEYLRSIALVLGPEAAAAAEPPVDIAQEGFDAIGATILSMSIDPVEFYERSAEQVAEAVLDAPGTIGALAPCVVSGTNTMQCYQEIATNVGRLLWRRPLTTEEVASLADVAAFASAWESPNDFDDAVKYELMAMLQSPQFLYVTEVGVPDEPSGFRKLEPYELASRMSFFLLGRTPDADLLDKAEAGELGTDEQIRAVAKQMIESDEAKLSLDTFYDELYRLRFLATTAKSSAIFPEWTQQLAAAMRQETLLLVNDIVWEQDADIRTVLNADYSFVDATLATHYGVTPPTDGTFKKVTWPATQKRAGFISQGSFLAHQSGPLRNSPTKRGKFVLQFVLCRNVPPPPANVIPELPADPPGDPTLQELLEQHMEDDSCASCHSQTDPVGFAFEFYDAIGRFRTTDNGKPVSGAGEVEGVGEWNNATDLGNLLASHDDTTTCIVKNFIRGKLGHTEKQDELPAVDELAETLAENSYSLKSLLVDMTANRLFQYVNEPR